MLIAIRSKVTSWIAKILFVLIALSFAVFGIGDVFRGKGPEQAVVLEVGERKVTMLEFDVAFREEVRRLQQMFGAALDIQQARALGLESQTIDRLINERVFDWLSDRLGTQAGEDLLRQRIAEEKAFKSPDGQFSPALFRQQLLQAGLSEGQYLALLAKDIARAQVSGVVMVGARADATVASVLDGYRNERRSAETITVRSADVVLTQPEPSDEQLAAHYQANTNSFMAPEYRTLTVAVIDPVKVGAAISLDPAAVQQAYESRIAEFTAPETRTIEQAVVSDKAAAEAIATAAASAPSLQAAVTAAGVTGAQVSELKDLAADVLPAELNTPIFALAQGGIAGPIESVFGWHVIRLTAISPAATRAFADVQANLEQELRHDQAAEQVLDLSNSLEDELAGGATLEQAATTAGATVLTITAIDSTGKLRDGGTAPLPQGPEILSGLFGIAKGATSPVLPGQHGEVVIGRVDEIISAAPRPLADVRAAVIADWQTAQRNAQAKERADALAAALKEGPRTAAAVAEGQAALSVGSIKGLRRDGQSEDEAGAAPDGAVQTALFGLKAVGETVVVSTGTDYVVTKLTEIRAATADPAGVSALTRELEGQMADDLMEQLVAALRQDAGVIINNSAIDRFYAPVE